jgi:succinate dehydrogenase/fumarate reductase cytochrome b subunit
MSGQDLEICSGDTRSDSKSVFLIESYAHNNLADSSKTITITMAWRQIFLLKGGAAHKRSERVMFIWIFHRVTGILLIFLIAIKIISGLGLTGRISVQDVIYGLHFGNAVSMTIDIALIFLVTFHALYGIRTILVDLGIKREKLLLWGFSGAGVVIVTLAMLFVYILPA